MKAQNALLCLVEGCILMTPSLALAAVDPNTNPLESKTRQILDLAPNIHEFLLAEPAEIVLYGSRDYSVFERDGAALDLDSEEKVLLREGTRIELLGVTEDEEGDTYLLARIDNRTVAWVKESQTENLAAIEQNILTAAAAKGFITPVNGRITSRPGMRRHPILKRKKYHAGTDYAAPTGTPVKAAASGTVSVAGNQRGYGKVVYIEHANGKQTRYAHLSRILVKPGQKVSQGDLIGKVGSTGASTGPHLHFEVR